MASNLFSGLLSPSALVIRDQEDGAIQVKSLKTVNVRIRLTSTAMRHMREDGSTIVDSRIIQPSIATIEAFCQDSDTVKQVNNLLMDRANFYSISSKGVLLNNMMSETEQISQSPDMMSAVPIRISFKQVLSKDVLPLVVQSAADSTLVDRGMTLLGRATNSVSDIYNKIKSIF